jgi:Sulfotransferase family
MRNSGNLTKCPDTAETRREKPIPIHDTPPWHLPPYYFEDENSHYTMFGNPYANATLFAVVRNPYERAVSEYLYFCEELKNRTPGVNNMNSFLGNIFRRIKDYMPLNASLKIQPKAYYTFAGHFIPQYDFVYDRSNRCVVEHVLHFETLSDEFPALMDQYNLSSVVLAAKEMGRHSRNKNRLGVENLTLSNLRIIEKIYQRDFEVFGYASNRSLLQSSV